MSFSTTKYKNNNVVLELMPGKHKPIWAMQFKWIILLAVSILPFPLCLAQYNEFVFRHYTADDGLFHNTVCSIVQDKKGFMWFGTGGGGLSKFDGINFSNYTYEKNQKGSIGGNTVFSLFLDKEGIVWAGTLEGGVSRYVPETNSFVVYRHSPNNEASLDNDYIRSIFEDSKGRIFIGTLTGLNVLNKKDWTIQRIKCPIHGQMFSIIENRKHQILVGSDHGLFYLDERTKTLQPFPFSDKTLKRLTSYIFPLIQDKNGNYWLGTKEGLVKIASLENQTFEYYQADPRNKSSMLTNFDIRALKEDKEGRIWIGSGQGLSCYDPNTKKFRHFQNDPNNPNSLGDNSIYSIFIDDANNFWIGTTNNGVNYFCTRPVKFELYQHITGDKNSLSNNIVNYFTICDSVLYVATAGGLNTEDLRTGIFKVYLNNPNNINSISSNNIYTIYVDHRHTIWIGTFDNGLNQFDPKTGTFKRYLEKSRVLSIVDDDDINKLWVASLSDLKLFDKRTGAFTTYEPDEHPDSLHPFPTLLYKTSNNLLWIANDDMSGLACFIKKNNRFVNLSYNENKPNSLINNGVISLYENKKGPFLWIATKNGLCKYDYLHNVFKAFTTYDGLPSNNIAGVIEDKNGNVWISTHNGLSCYNPKSGKFKNYNKNDGLQGAEFSNNACYISNDGKLFFGGKKGFNAFYPENITINKIVPPVVFTQFYINNQPASYGTKHSILKKYITETKEITLSYYQRSFSIEFAALDYTAPNNNQYIYKLDNFDKTWTNNQNDNKAIYTNISPGSYTFMVKASNSDGVFNEVPATLHIKILPPPWKTGWAYILYSLFIIFNLVLFARYLIVTSNRKHHQKLKRLQEQKEKEITQLKIDFFTNIAHEIRTPLTLISGPLERLMHSETSNKEVLEEYQLMQKNTKHLLRLVNQLLNFRKIEDNKYELSKSTFNIVELVRDLYTRFTPLARQKNYDFTFRSEKDSCVISADYDLIVSAISNLITNAFKFTKDWIEISIKMNQQIGSNSELQKSVIISVQDNGIGIPKEKTKKIFDPFFQIRDQQKQSDKDFSGIGLGLAYTRSIVDLHSGILRVDSEPGKGSVFSIILNVELSTINQKENTDKEDNTKNENLQLDEFILTESLQAAYTPEINISTKNPEILIVEDNKDLRLFLCKQLQNAYIIHQADNGEQALEITKQKDIELIITDVMMPVMDGFELCKALKSNPETNHIPIIILTAKADIDSKIEGTMMGADAYIEKPFSLEYLLALIRNLIDTRVKLKAKFLKNPFTETKLIATNKADELFLDNLNKLINNNIGNQSYSIDDIAKSLSFSRSGFHKKLKAISGLTPNDYIKLIRLRKASELIRAGQYRINEVCYMVGFSSPSYFSKCFQEQFGVSPSDLLNQ